MHFQQLSSWPSRTYHMPSRLRMFWSHLHQTELRLCLRLASSLWFYACITLRIEPSWWLCSLCSRKGLNRQHQFRTCLLCLKWEWCNFEGSQFLSGCFPCLALCYSPSSRLWGQPSSYQLCLNGLYCEIAIFQEALRMCRLHIWWRVLLVRAILEPEL